MGCEHRPSRQRGADAAVWRQVRTGERLLRRLMDQPIACDLTALDAAQHQRHDVLAAALFADLSGLRELPEGYAVRLTLSELVIAAEFITLERLCCPFLTFALRVEPGAPWVWLELSGSVDIKTFLVAEFALDRRSVI